MRTFIILISVFTIFISSAFGATTPTSDSLVCGKPYVDTRCRSTLALADALASAQSTSVAVKCTAPITLNANTTIANAMNFEKGCLISCGSYTITHSGPVTPVDFQVYNCSAGQVAGLSEATPEMFGALGNGSHDDTDAISAANVSCMGKHLIFKLKEYVFSTLTQAYNNSVWEGISSANVAQQTDGSYQATVLRSTETTTDALTYYNSVTPIRNITLKNLSLIGATDGKMLFFNNTNNITLNKVLINNKVNGAGNGIHFYQSYFVDVIDSQIIKSVNQRVVGSVGVMITNPADILSGLFNFINTDVTGFDENYQFGEKDITATYRLRNINLLNSQAKSGNIGIGIYKGAEDVSINNMYSEGNLSTGVDLRFGPNHIDIKNSFFNNPTAAGPQIRIGNNAGDSGEKYWKNIAIKNNSFEGIPQNGIAISVRGDSSTTNSDNLIISEGNEFTANTLGGGYAIALLEGGINTDIYDVKSSGSFTAVLNQTVKARALKNVAGYSSQVDVKSASTTVTLSSTSAEYQTINTDAAGTGVKLLMPSLTEGAGKLFYVKNSGSTYNLVAKDSGDTTIILNLVPGASGIFWNDGTNYFGTLASLSSRGSFTLNNGASSVTVSDTGVRTTSLIFTAPTNTFAGGLEGSAQKLYVKTRTSGTSFVMETSNVSAATGTCTFNYQILN